MNRHLVTSVDEVANALAFAFLLILGVILPSLAILFICLVF